MMTNRYTTADAVRFWAKVDKSGDCWLWQAYRFPNGYGKFFAQRAHRYAHRFAYEIAVGPIPDGLFVCHRCDVRACVNPAHLFAGTQAENLADMAKKGRSTSGDRNPSRLYPERQARGEGHGMVKLTAEDVAAIRANPPTKRGDLTRLAERYGVSHGQMRRILRGERWAHV